MGNCELNEEIAKKVADFLLKIPDDVWKGIFDKLPEFQKMPEEFKNWSFGKQAVVLMVGALNDYRTNSEKYWEKFYVKFQTQPEHLRDVEKLLEEVYCQSQNSEKDKEPQKCERMREFLKSRLAAELWKQNEEYFKKKENLESIWKKLEKLRPHSKNKTVPLAIKDLTILVMKRTGDTSILDSVKLPVLVDRRIQKVTKNIVGCDDDLNPDEVRDFWKMVLRGSNNGSTKIKGLKNEKPWLTMIHLDTLLWFIGGDCSKLFSLLVSEYRKN